jgi:arginine/lysine/ornithine decarboxylase
MNLDETLDVTELPGLDNLLAPEACIAESMEQLKTVYGSDASYYLVNGSSCGILAAISAVCRRGDTIIMARHSHKSVYHAVALLELHPVYLYPGIVEPYGMCGSITPEQVEEALHNHPEAKAVIFPSPTYEGILSDVKRISNLVHTYDAVLIVDEAHGAHLEFGTDSSTPAIRCGADIVIESLHKTMPCYTQCAILHLSVKSHEQQADSVDDEPRNAPEQQENLRKYQSLMLEKQLQQRIERYLNIYETSSPSYLLVANMENCIATMDEWRNTEEKAYYERLRRYRKKWEALQVLRILSPEEACEKGAYAYDETKLIISHPDMSGEELLKVFEETYGLVVEMASLRYVLAISTVMDSEEAFARLDDALQRLDQMHVEKNGCDKDSGGKQSVNLVETNGIEDAEKVQLQLFVVMHDACQHEDLLPGVAWNMETELIDVTLAEGRIAGDYVTVYPPGIPVCVPGEVITRENLDYLIQCYQEGLTIHGISEGERL